MVSFDEADDPDFIASSTSLRLDNENAIAKELSKLCLKERENILHDIHGVNDVVEESPELLSRSLKEMDDALSSISDQNKTTQGYLLAELESPKYVQDEAFRLMFLRSEGFDGREAAYKMQAFFDQKLELFGSDKLCRSIELSDFSKEDMECLQNGHVQILPKRDQAGRAIIVLIADHIHYANFDNNELHNFFYIVMSILEDEDSQKNGIIMISIGTAPARLVTPFEIWKLVRMNKALPFRLQCSHQCRLGSWFGALMSWRNRISGNKVWMRSRNHSGTLDECIFSLMTFGIPTRHIPFSKEDPEKLDRTQHREWIKTRKRLELNRRDNKNRSYSGDADSNNNNNGDHDTTAPAPRTIILPMSKDILFGRGTPFRNHAGNLRLLVMVESLENRYDTLGRQAKTDLAEDVVRNLKGGGTRFLKQNTDFGTWEEVDESKAREKVSQAFRSLRGNKNKSGTAPTTTTTQSVAPSENRSSNTNTTTITSTAILEPSSKDVLFGRGLRIQKHSGNLLLAKILDSLQGQYESMERNEKTELIKNVIRGLKSQGARFLKQNSDDGTWEEVDHSMAREKIGQAFRSLRVAKNKGVITTIAASTIDDINSGNNNKEADNEDDGFTGQGDCAFDSLAAPEQSCTRDYKRGRLQP